MKTFYQCDPELFVSCKHTLCGKECRLTSFEEYAQRDEFGRPIVACIDDISRKQGESEDEYLMNLLRKDWKDIDAEASPYVDIFLGLNKEDNK